MSKKSLFVLGLCCLVLNPLSAKVTKEYQRPSLHMILMTNSDKAGKSSKMKVTDAETMSFVSNAWTNYDFPSLYNNFKIPFQEAKVDGASGSIMDVMGMNINNMSLAELKEVLEMMDGQKYRQSLKDEVDKISDEVAHQLVEKWWSIGPNGTVSDTLLFRLACYSATQNQAGDAAQTTLGAQQQLFNELADATMANTYITFSKLDFYNNEPIAAFTRDIMKLIAGYTAAASPIPGVYAAALAAAEATYESMKDGYTAYTNNLLYRLEWNDSIANEFYSIWKDGSHIDMEKFKAMKFNLIYVGNTAANATCMVKKEDMGKGSEHMVHKTIHKALNKQFSNLQRDFEEFRPMVPVLGLDAKGGIIADMGTKEDVKVGDKFNLLEPVTNEKGITKYVFKAAVKVVKWTSDKEGEFVDGVWNNEEIDNAAAADLNTNDGFDIVGTHLSKFKNASPSMFVKKAK